MQFSVNSSMEIVFLMARLVEKVKV
jgi:hypothetical protein